ncbi:N6-adenosine-methyltransferase catalytic subunit isoform X4 [Columba livia]|uniref:N6-adenosine-methyltransferase catalytic subunit isoform X4 n=1 Tax=Columba livia TaxID=8932 RepID=UPI0031BB9DC5
MAPVAMGMAGSRASSQHGAGCHDDMGGGGAPAVNMAPVAMAILALGGRGGAPAVSMAPVAMAIRGGCQQPAWRRWLRKGRGVSYKRRRWRRATSGCAAGSEGAGGARRSVRFEGRGRGSRARFGIPGPRLGSPVPVGFPGPRSHVGHVELHPGAQEAAALAAGAAAAPPQDGAARSARGERGSGGRPAPHGQPRPLPRQPRPRRPLEPIRSLRRRGPAPRPRPGAAAAAAIGRRGAPAARRLGRHWPLHRHRRGAGAAAPGGEPAGEVRGAGADRDQAAAGRRRHPRHLRRPLQAGGHDGRRPRNAGNSPQKRQEAARRRGGGGGRQDGRRRGARGRQGGQEMAEASERGGSGDREPAESAVHQGAAEQEGEPGDPGAAEHDHGQGAVDRGEVPVARARAGAGVLRPRHQGGVRARQRRRAALPPPALPGPTGRLLPRRRIINKHTDESLGDCSFLNTCFHMDTCK